MIQARHAAWADRIFHPYVTWLFKRHFHALRLLGKIPETNPELPLLLLPNHSTWWDGFFVYLLNKKLFERQPYLMRREDQLSRYRFFTRLGAYSINPQSSGSIKGEILVLNDGSTDRTTDIARQVAARDARVKILVNLS